jgi:hypothetical protein
VRRHVATTDLASGLLADGGRAGRTTSLPGSFALSPAGGSCSAGGNIETGGSSLGTFCKSTTGPPGCEAGFGLCLALLLLQSYLVEFAIKTVRLKVWDRLGMWEY